MIPTKEETEIIAEGIVNLINLIKKKLF